MADDRRKNFKNILVSTDRDEMALKFKNMLMNVSQMIAQEGPTYAVWIMFQVGNSKPVIFNNASNDLKQNLIASLSIDKTGAGVANCFTLDVVYDPFHYGQSPSDEIEALDDLLARAIDVDLDDSEENENLKAYIQYGYTCTDSDLELISPKYELLLTGFSSKIDTITGIGKYTFTGYSTISQLSDSKASFERVEKKPVLDTVIDVLYKYYGDPDDKPAGANSKTVPLEDSPKYKISVPKSLRDDQQNTTIEAKTGITPWQYCTNALQNMLSKTDSASGLYDKTSNASKRPSYSLYITDTDRTIHIDYVSPLMDNNLKIDWPFTWNHQYNNLVTRWEPQVDLRLYIIQTARYKREREQLVNDYLEQITTNTLDETKDSVAKSINLYKSLKLTPKEYAEAIAAEELRLNDKEVYEMYDAEITLVGIPADPPLCAEITVTPRILEAQSRTAGVYVIKGCKDEISTKGDYTTTLKLFRIRSLDQKVYGPEIAKNSVQESSTSKKAVQNTSMTNTLYHLDYIGLNSEEILKKYDPNKKSGVTIYNRYDGLGLSAIPTTGLYPFANKTNSIMFQNNTPNVTNIK